MSGSRGYQKVLERTYREAEKDARADKRDYLSALKAAGGT